MVNANVGHNFNAAINDLKNKQGRINLNNRKLKITTNKVYSISKKPADLRPGLIKSIYSKNPV